MALPIPVAPPGGDAPGGETYGAVLVRDADRDAVVAELRGIRFDGWIAPADAGWTAVLADPGDGVVASARRGLLEVAAHLGAGLGADVVAIRVRRDRQLVLAAWRGADELGRYSSDPSAESGADDEVLSDPLGADLASTLAELCERADAADDLETLLDEELEIESVSESERLARVLRLLGLPSWLVASAALPRDIPTGPSSRSLTRLRAGRPGPAGVLARLVVGPVRRRRTPPPAIADPPRADDVRIDPWLL